MSAPANTRSSGAKNRFWTGWVTVCKVIDGDTIDVDADLGWRVTIRARLRVRGVNCPESNTQDGVKAADYTRTQVPAGSVLWADVHRLDLHGRGEAEITLENGLKLGDLLIAAHHAKPANDRGELPAQG